MDISSVCIVGGSGFVGRAIADHLSTAGTRVRVVTRRRMRAMPLTVLPTVEIVVADPHDTASLARCFDDMDAVVNLVGILHERGRETFERCHVELPRKVPVGLVVCSARTYTRDYQDVVAAWSEADIAVWGSVPERVTIATGPEGALSPDGLDAYRSVWRRALRAVRES